MNLILTMAGRYSRFLNEGYKIPKYLLPWGNKSILGEIISEMNKHNDFKNIFLVANIRDDVYMPHVRKIMQIQNIPLKNLYLISDTTGQAETAYLALEKFEEQIGSDPVLFHNIDTILYNRKYEKIANILLLKDGFIDVFKSSNHNYSYVLIEEKKVQSIAEKILISNNATSGLYGFRNSQVFLNYYDTNTLFISEVYQKMLEDNRNISIGILHNENDTLVLGTPIEYLNLAYMLDLKLYP